MKTVLYSITKFLIVLVLIFSSHFVSAQIWSDDCNAVGTWSMTGGTANWQNVTPTAPAGDHTGGGKCFYTEGTSQYAIISTYVLTSPVIDLTGYTNCQLTFWMYLDAEGTADLWDGGFVAYVDDTRFEDADLSLSYHGTLDNTYSNPYGGQSAWTHDVTSWTQVTVDISAYDGDANFQIKFKFGADNYVTADLGWAIDDVSITGTCAAPATQATSFSAPTVNKNDMTVQWTRGNGNEVIVLAKSGSAVDTDPSSGTSYTANAAFGSGDQIGTGNYVVYIGTGTSVSVTGLSEATTYHYAVYEYSTATPCYKIPALTGNATTDCIPPTTQASGVSVPTVNETSLGVQWTRGNGNEVIVLAKSGSAVDADPSNGISYTANAAFGSGDQIGTGNYVVYKGTETSVSVTGLTEGNAYYFACYENNTATNCYMFAGATVSEVTSCSSVGGISTDEWISRVQMNTTPALDKNSGGPPAAGYADYTADGPFEVTKGATYNFTGTVGSGATPYNEYIRVYVDWNRNSSFTDVGESYDIGTRNGAGDIANTIAVPAGASTGTAIMRVMLKYDAYPTGPCEDQPYGETEDYTLNIVPSCTYPATQASGYSASLVNALDMTVQWTRGDGNEVIVLAKQGSAVDSDPVDGMSYTANAAFESGDQIGTGNYVVYKGTGTSVSVTALSESSTYHYAVYEYITTSDCYKTPSLTGDQATNSCTPSTQATNFSATTINANDMTVQWTRGSGDEVIVLARVGSAVDTEPSNGTSYTANTTFASGDQIGTGNYVVYKGTGTSVSVTSLSAYTTYHYAVYEFDNANNCYKTVGLTGNATTDCAYPSTQASDFSAPNINANDMTVQWTRGNGNEVIVLAKSGSAVDTDPSDGTTYTANAVFGSGDQIGTGNYVVYIGTGTSVPVTSLSAYTTYYYAIYEYIAAINCYKLVGLTGSATTDCAPPTTQATSFSTPTINANDMTVQWTQGNGDAGLIVVVREGSAVDTDPTSGTSYTANAVFGLGDQIGTGNYVVYKGTGTSVSITALTHNTTYHYALYEYNSSGICYELTQLTGNATTLELMSYISCTASQPNTTDVSKNTTNQEVIRLEVITTGAESALDATQFLLQTTGTTSVSDIENAKIWYTGTSSTFATTTQFGSTFVSPPSSPTNMTFSGTQTLAEGTNYFWLSYDVKAGATVSNVIDGYFQEVTVGSARTPIQKDPAGSRTIIETMQFSSCTAAQPNTTNVNTGDTDQEVIRIEVVTVNSVNPIDLTQMQVRTTGTDAVADIQNAKLWYTGTSSIYATSTQFGSTVAVPPATPTNITFSGTQTLVEGTNYFWLSYDVKGSATAGNIIDAYLHEIIVDASPESPTTSAPAGSRTIVSCTSTISSLPHTEDFEGGILGDWVQGTGDNINWTLSNATTPSTLTGPTGANEGSYYAFTEASSQYSKTANLISPCYDLSTYTSANITFDYHMCGSTMGSLYLEVEITPGSDSWTILWSKTGQQHATEATAWSNDINVNLDAYVGTTIKLRFRGYTGTNYYSDMAIDDIIVDGEEPCPVTISSYPYAEGFETGLGDWVQDSGDDIDWIRDASGTPSSSTGPSSGSDASTWYVFTEGTSNNNKIANLRSPCFDLSSLSYPKITFDYHMYGADMGGLYLEVETTPGSGSWTTLWSLTGDQGDTWYGDEFVDLTAYAGTTIKLRFRGNTFDYASDMAVDDINVSEGCAQPDTQASAFSSSVVNVFDMTANWARGNGDNVLVVAREGSAVSGSPASGTTYAANAAYGSGDAVGGGFVVYSGTGTSVVVTNLNDETTYHFAIYEFTDATKCYKNPALTGNETTASCTPAIQATSFSASPVQVHDMTINWTRGSGDEVIVLAKSGSAVDIDPTNGSTYTANAAFGSGQQIGAGNYVVYQGTGTEVTVTGLTAETDYHYAIYEVGTTYDCYKTPALTGNASTMCTNLTPLPYTEDFAGGALPACWQMNSIQGGSWRYDDPGSRNLASTTGNPFAILDPAYENVGFTEADLISPAIDLSEYSVINLEFKHYVKGLSSNTDAIFYYSTNGGSSWTQHTQWLGTSTANGATYNEDLSAEVAGESNVKFKWYFKGFNTGWWAVDDINLTGTLACIPTTQASAFSASPINKFDMTVNWTRGNGEKVLVLAREGSAVDTDPTLGAGYAANAAFSSGDQIGTGNYVVYIGTGTSVSVTALSGVTTYHYAVYEYDNTDKCYKIPGLTGNATTTNPMTFVSCTAAQPNTDDVGKGTTNQEVIRLEVVTDGNATTIDATEFQLRTTGTTSISDIENAKVWYTGTSSTFATTTQFGSTVASPPATPTNMTFSGTQTLAEGTNYFWLSYDVKAGATTTNVIDGYFQEITVDATGRIPTMQAPAGNRPIADVMTYVSSTTAQPTTTTVIENATNNEVIRLEIVTINSGSPQNISEFILRTDGSNEATQDIENAKVWYTGTSSTFVTTTQFGSTFASPPASGNDMTISGDQNLVEGTNYFWLSYDIKSGAANGNLIDALFNQVTVSGSNKTPIETNPAGYRVISKEMVYSSCSAEDEIAGWVAPGETTQEVLRFYIYNNEVPDGGFANPLSATQIKLRTDGSDAPLSDNVENAKVWYTGASSEFAATTQFGSTVASPPVVGVDMIFNGSQELVTGYNYFWLSYDIKAGAADDEYIETIFQDCTVDGIARTPSTQDPNERTQIHTEVALQMYYDETSASHFDTDDVMKGMTNQEAMRVYILTQNTPYPIDVTEIKLQTTGTTDFTEIKNARLWYTGSSSAFAITQQYGATVATPPSSGIDMTFNETLTLESGYNYFWLTYDVMSSATIGNVIDAKYIGCAVDGTTYTNPITAEPVGSRTIIAPIESSTGLFVLNGDSYYTTPPSEVEVTLTDNITNEAGSAWYRYKTDLDSNFTVEFSVYLGDNSASEWSSKGAGTRGADGITFTFQNKCISCAGTGSQLGFGGGFGDNAIDPAIAIEFDTYRNTDKNDPTYATPDNGDDHMGIVVNNSVIHEDYLPEVVNVGELEDGVWHPVKVSWTATAKKLEVEIDGVSSITYYHDIVNNIFDGNSEVYWGFTASTGMYSNLQKVNVTTFPNSTTQLVDTTVVASTPVQEAVAFGAHNYSWTPDNGTIDDPTVHNPTFTTTVTTEYTVFFEDDCGNLLSDKFTITIPDPLPVELINFIGKCVIDGKLLKWETASETNCDYFLLENSRNGSIFTEVTKLDGKGNYNGLSEYQWLDRGDHGDYYRLKQVDFDGQFEYSKIINLNCPEQEPIAIYPNPADNYIYVEYNDKMVVEILSLDSQEVISTSKKYIDISHLSPSVYIIIVKNEHGEIIKTERIIVM